MCTMVGIPVIVQKFETFFSFKKVKYDSRCQLETLVKNGKSSKLLQFIVFESNFH